MVGTYLPSKGRKRLFVVCITVKDHSLLILIHKLEVILKKVYVEKVFKRETGFPCILFQATELETQQLTCHISKINNHLLPRLQH